MKRILATILAFLYLSTSMGATIHLHYCMGKLISWGFLDHESKTCTYCGMSKMADNKDGFSAIPKNCCTDDHKEIKTDQDQKVTSTEFQFLNLSPDAIADHLNVLPGTHILSFTLENQRSHAPPLSGDKPIFLLNSNFRI